MKRILFVGGTLLLLNACTKESMKPETLTGRVAPLEASKVISNPAKADLTVPNSPVGKTITYTIPAGEHHSDKNFIRAVLLNRMVFKVTFNSSGIYTAAEFQDPLNIHDINMLYGFAENGSHKYNSARIGWTFVDGQLRLFGYAYVKGVRKTVEITSIPLANAFQEINCSITLTGSNYTFVANGISKTLPRGTNTSISLGYQLYPYFGGDEVAPHDITIQIHQTQ